MGFPKTFYGAVQQPPINVKAGLIKAGVGLPMSM